MKSDGFKLNSCRQVRGAGKARKKGGSFELTIVLRILLTVILFWLCGSFTGLSKSVRELEEKKDGGGGRHMGVCDRGSERTLSLFFESFFSQQGLGFHPITDFSRTSVRFLSAILSRTSHVGMYT
jgi:hypothetical protein